MAQEPETEPAEDAATAAYLKALGDRVRRIRAQRGMTRRLLARDSGVSERYLAELESGRGNISILLLRQISEALGLPVGDLLGETAEQPVELGLIQEFLQHLPKARLARVRAYLLREFGGDPEGR